MTNILSLALPEIILTLGLICSLLFGLLSKQANKHLNTTYLIMSLLALSAIICFSDFTSERKEIFSDMLIKDKYTISIKTTLIIFGICCLFLALDWLKNSSSAGFEYPIAFGFVILGLNVSISAGNLFLLYVGIEIVSVSLYWLLAYKKEVDWALEASIKFFVISSIGSAFFIYGLSLIYGFTGTTDIEALQAIFTQQAEQNQGIILGLIFILCGLLIKIGAAPFHSWLADIYEGASAPVTALLVVVVEIALLCITFRLMLRPFGLFIDIWGKIIEVIAIASIFFGSFSALRQNNIKRFVAYSTLANIGYAMIAISTATPGALKEMLFFLILYGIMTIGLFAITSSLRNQGNLCEDINKLSGLGHKEPTKALLFTIILLSLAGLPPFAGFLGKFGILLMAINSKAYILALVAILSNVIAVYYYFKILNIMYFEQPKESFDSFSNSSTFIIRICAFLLLFITLYPSWLTKICEQASLVIAIR